MNVLITGGTGFIGSALTRALMNDNMAPIVLSRKELKIPDIKTLTLDSNGLIAERHLAQVCCVVNLAGENIGTRWTSDVKRRIYDSRVLFTKNLVDSIQRCHAKGLPYPTTIVQASAVGYYGSSPQGVQTEESPPGKDFLASLCKDWEAAAFALRSLGVRVVILRFGVVLGPGGVLKKMALPLKLFAGGVIGSGEQMMSWIHRSDLIQFTSLALQDESISGVYNLTTPHPVSMSHFMNELGAQLSRPSWTKMPAWAARIIWGEMADSLLLADQSIAPTRLQARAFSYSFPIISSALNNIYSCK